MVFAQKKTTHGFVGCSRVSFRGRILGKVEKNAEKNGTTLVSFWTRKKSGVMYLQGGPPADRYKWGEITPISVLPESCVSF